MGTLLSKVQIGGVTIKDDSSGSDPLLLINWEYERVTEGGISELSMNALKSVNDTIALVVGQTVSIWKGFTTSTDTKIFEGYVSQFEPEGGIIKITCKDKMWDLIRKNVNKVYESSGAQSGQISAIAKDLIETYGGLTADEQATGTATGETIDEFRCPNTDIWERLLALAKAVRYQIWYDAVNDTVHFEPAGYNDSATTLTVGTDIIGMPKWTYDTSRMVNDLRVDGAVSETQIRKPLGTGNGVIDTTTDFDTTDILLDKTPKSVELILENANPPTEVKTGGTKDSTSGEFYYVDRINNKVMPATGTTFTAGHRAIVNYTWLAPSPIHQTNDESISTYGTWMKQITLEDINSIADAEARTTQILATFSQPFLLGEFLVKSLSTIDVNIGDKVTIVDAINKPNINEELVVTRQVIKYPGSNQELSVGDEPLRLADWQLDVETRLKRIEEILSLKNQDLILELYDFANELTPQPRYRKMTTQTIEDSCILGHPANGVLGTAKLGDRRGSEANSFIQQYENSYTENFIDADFEDSTGTASWSTTGSVTFTSGQIALSSSIDYANGTITTATLTSTEVSGSFDYEMTADGTNWESATSGVAHTFSDTGTDLRWRATENAASTGEISQIKIINYH